MIDGPALLVRRLIRRLSLLVGKERRERDMDEEMRFHVDMEARDLTRQGVSPEGAARRAHVVFGGRERYKEEARDAFGTRLVEDLAQDLRFVLRYFARNKLTVAIIVSVFALGIGANTALVTTLQSQFQRPAPTLPEDPAHVRLWVDQRATPTQRWRPRAFTGVELRELAAHRETLAAVAAWLTTDVVINAGDSIGPRGRIAHFVTPNYFTALGVRLAAGTGFTAPETETDMSAVISYAMAEQLYGTPASAVGQRVLINNVPVRVVGLAPKGFQGAVRNMGRPALWMPISSRADIARVPPRWLDESPTLEVFARLAPDASPEQATSVTQLVVTRTLPDSAARVGMTRRAQVISLHAMEPHEGNQDTIVIFGLLGFAGLLLLLITCTNVSSLMVAAAVSRRHEIAVRLSLGASRGRVMRQLLTETTLLAVAGGAAGLLVCWWLLRWVAGGDIDGNSVAPDALTLAYTMAIAVGTGIVFGLSPALHATRGTVSVALHDSGAGVSRKSRLQRGFVIAQIVLSQPLLVMLGITLSVVLGEYAPMQPELSERVTTVTFRPMSTGPAGARHEAVDSLVSRIAAHQDVAAVVREVGWVTTRGFIALSRDTTVSKEQMPTTIVIERAVPGWFALLDVPIVLGRDVSLADTAEARWPVVVPSTLARRLWGTAHPIGQRLLSWGRDSVELTVVGVYDATRVTTSGNKELRAFTTAGKERWRSNALLVRTRGLAEPFLPELRTYISDLNPELPVSRLQTLAQHYEEERRSTLAIGSLVGVGGGMALLLASLGLYGVIALAVRQRTREIGIRIALGAKPARVARMFLTSGVRMGVVALAIGMPICMVMMRFGLQRAVLLAPNVSEWAVGAGVATALLLVAAAATWVPARRASLVDPAKTLRVE